MTRRIIPHTTGLTLDAFTLLTGEVAYDETNGRMRLGDGATPGGRRVDVELEERLGETTGAALVRTSTGDTVEDAIAARPTTSEMEALEALASAAAGRAEAAAVAGGGAFPNAAATNVPRGVTGHGTITGGSGGTNGTFALGFSGGNFSINPTGTFTVSGGAVTAITITGAGLYIGSSPTAPTPTFTASSGLTGASVTLTTGFLVASGASYRVATVDGNHLDLYRNNSGTPQVSSPLDRVPQSQYLATLAAGIDTITSGPGTITATGTTFTNNAFYSYPTSISTVTRYITSLQIPISSVGTVGIVVAFVEGDGTLTFVSHTTFPVTSTGLQTISTFVEVPPGCVAGIRFTAGGGYFESVTIPESGTIWTVVGGLPTSHTAKTTATNIWVKFKLTLTGDVAAKARVAYETSSELAETVGGIETRGWADPIVATGTDPVATYTMLDQRAAATDGTVTRVTVGTAVGGPARILVCSMSGLTITIHEEVTVTLTPGVNVVEVNLPIEAGQYCGISGGTFKYQASNPEGIAAWVRSQAAQSGDTMISTAAFRFEVQWEISTGLFAELQGAGSLTGTGLTNLAAEDFSGGTDLATPLASARSSHPYPYLRPGTPAATSVVAHGGGLWGPGRLFIGGERYFVRERPKLTNLWDACRASLLEHIANDDVLVLIADSIGHFAYADSGATHFFNRMTRFLNYGIAADEPIMTALRPSSSYTPAFYGVTVTGGSTGTNGPLRESLILADGDSISFSGTYEQVDVFYTQQSGAGSLAFKFNGGAAFKTVNAAGSTELDKFSGPTLTAETGAGTYTITASGGPVEITGLLRLGTSTAATATGHRRVRTMRAAHGSYMFSTFTVPAITSILEQASYAGGKAVPIVALGINDSINQTPATLISNATVLFDTLEAGGCDRFFVVPPLRPSSAWNASYAANDYDSAIGALRAFYRERGYKVVPLDGIDWVGEGLLQDGLHPNNLGNDRYAQVVLETIAEG
jgi:hypothetical protein